MKNMNLLRKISEMCHGKGKKMVKLRRCKRCSKFKKEFKKNPGDLQNDCYKIVSCTATSVKLKRVPVFQAHTSDQVSIIRAGVVGQQLDSPLHFAPANDPLLLNGDFSYVFSQLNNQMPQIENEPTNFEIERQNNGNVCINFFYFQTTIF